MNSLERVFGTIKGDSVDRTPAIAVLSTYSGKMSGIDMKVLYSDPESYLKAQETLQNKLPLDMVLAPFDYSIIAEAFGGEVKYFVDAAPNMKRPPAESAEDALKLKMPDPDSCGRMPFMLEATKLLADKYSQEKPLFAAIPGPCSMPVLLLGMDLWMETLLFNSDAAKDVVDYCADFLELWTSALIKKGVISFVVTEGLAAAQITNRQIFESSVLPKLDGVLKRIEAPMVIHHTGGSINGVLDLMLELSGVIGFSVGAEDDLSEARRIIGPDKLLLGNMDNILLKTTDSEKIEKMCCEMITQGGSDGPYILANSGGDIPVDTPIENISAMLMAAQ